MKNVMFKEKEKKNMLKFKMICENSESFMEFTEEMIKDKEFLLKMIKEFYEKEKKKCLMNQ